MINRKRLLQTITDPMITGIFHQIATNETFEFITTTNQEELDLDYYLSHSGNKYISNLYNNILDKYPNDDPLVKLANIIETRYKSKWDRIYQTLITEYNPINNYDMIEVETPDLEDHRIIKVDSDVTNQTDLNDYGFNSNNPVPTSKNTSRVTGEGDNNKTDDTLTKSGTRTLTRSGNIGVTTSAQLVEGEIKLRALYQMRDIIFNDIDNVLCLSIY